MNPNPNLNPITNTKPNPNLNPNRYPNPKVLTELPAALGRLHALTG